MPDRLISGDNHIDLTYCPPDLWSSRAPVRWKLLVPRVEELEDGLHWFVEGHQQDQYLEPIIPIVGEDNIIWGADYPHPDCIWPDSRRHLDKNLGGLPERVRRKITRENVATLYHL